MRQLKIFGEMARRGEIEEKAFWHFYKSIESSFALWTSSIPLPHLLILSLSLSGLIYRAHRPVYWSPSSRTALAEAELEYEEKHLSRSCYVRFPLSMEDGIGQGLKVAASENPEAQKALQEASGIDLVVWTTTPWTLPSNMVSFFIPCLSRGSKLGFGRLWQFPSSYSLLSSRLLLSIQRCDTLSPGSRRTSLFSSSPLKESRRSADSRWVSAVRRMSREKLGVMWRRSCLSQVSWIDFNSSRPFIYWKSATNSSNPLVFVFFQTGTSLLDSRYRHLFLDSSRPSRPILPASFVTDSSGTGLVHAAPAHGADDYEMFLSAGLLLKEPLISPVDDDGNYTQEILKLGHLGRDLVGLPVLGEGGKLINQILNDQKVLISEVPMVHKYPYDWRTKLPVITRWVDSLR